MWTLDKPTASLSAAIWALVWMAILLKRGGGGVQESQQAKEQSTSQIMALGIQTEIMKGETLPQDSFFSGDTTEKCFEYMF